MTRPEGGERYDFVVVGGGTAGSILAARLSEEPAARVLLLEAGDDYPEPAPLELCEVRGPVTEGFNWDFEAIVAEMAPPVVSGRMARVARVFEVAARHLGESPDATHLPASPGGTAIHFRYPLGKIMGGGSAVNGALALHARPEDYAAWAERGNTRWGWEQVRPFIRRLETGDDETPPLPMETARTEDLAPFQARFLETCLALGHPLVDIRQGREGGVGILPKSLDRGCRAPSSSLYLAPARSRPNLTVRPGFLVDRLCLEGRGDRVKATGVEVLSGGRRFRFSAGHVVLAAGAIQSPAILLRSGIGGAKEIARVGGRLWVDLSGVGENLTDHPAVILWGVPRDGECCLGEQVHQVIVQQRSTQSRGLCDLQLFMLSSVPTGTFPSLHDVVGSEVAVGISVVVATPASRGRVELVDLDPTHNPRIYLNCLREESDLTRMIEGLRLAWPVLRDRRLESRLARTVLWSQHMVDSDRLLRSTLRSTVRGTWHPTGTLRMGSEDDPMAVVDQRGWLRGCGNVTVADASIMPVIPSVPTNLTCMLIAERAAAELRKGNGEGGP